MERPDIACVAPPEEALQTKVTKLLEDDGFAVTILEDAAELLDGFDGLPSAVLLYAAQPSSDALSCIGPVCTHFEDAPLILVSSTIERWEVRAALTAGATGVLLSETLQTTLLSCLHAVLSGQICVPRVHARQIAPPALSSREKQILGLVVMGFANSQIAEQLFLAESTVKSHLSSAFRKLGVRSRNEAVNLILDPDRGLGMGILALSGEPLGSSSA
jgi:DNA-binding NarL/FixJ family response regulator